MRLKDRVAVTKEYEVLINAQNIAFSAYIDGPDEIRLDRYCNYTLVGTDAILGNVEYSLEETKLATISETKFNECIIHANTNNKLGDIILNAAYDGVTYTKIIKIIPLW